MSTYRMSEVSACERAVCARALKYNPMPPSERLKLAAREGERHEGWIVEDLIADGYSITDRQKEVVLSFPALTLVGHIDGIAEKDGNKFLLEIKSMSRFRFYSFRNSGLTKFKTYANQVACYYEAVKLPILYVVKNRDTGEQERVVSEQGPDFAPVLEMLLNVELCVRKNQLSDVRTEDGSDCDYCAFRYLCIAEKAFDDASQQAVPPKVAREAALRRLHAMKLEEEAKSIKAEVDPILMRVVKACDTRSVNIDNLTVTYFPASSYTSYPAAALRKHVPADILDKCGKKVERKEYIKCGGEE